MIDVKKRMKIRINRELIFNEIVSSMWIYIYSLLNPVRKKGIFLPHFYHIFNTFLCILKCVTYYIFNQLR